MNISKYKNFTLMGSLTWYKRQDNESISIEVWNFIIFYYFYLLVHVYVQKKSTHKIKC